MATLMKTL